MLNLTANTLAVSTLQVLHVPQKPENYGCNYPDRYVITSESNIFQYVSNMAQFIQIAETSPTVLENSIKASFNYYYEEWMKEIKYQSSTDVIADSFFFNKIIDFGDGVVPYIIEALKDTPSFLIIALYKITGENPVKPEHRGRIKEMAGDWIEWWKKKSSVQG
jgi:hypothetical protein